MAEVASDISSCLSEEEVLSFVAGRLPPERQAAFEAHIETCVACRELLSAAAIGGESLKAASSIMTWEEDDTLDARLVEVRLPVRPDLPASMKAGEEESRPTGKYPALHERLVRSPKEITTDVHVLRVGRSYVVGLPGEILIEYQIELRQKIESPFVFVSELAGDSIGYVPTAAVVREGGYEPGASYVTPEAGSILVKTALDAVRAMKG